MVSVTRMLHGAERDRVVDEQGCCGCCGFMEAGLLAFERDGEAIVRCAECMPYEDTPERDVGFRAVLMPEISVPAFSHYVRALAFATFAALTDRLAGHEFASGTLPSAFVTQDGWKAPLRWKSVSEGMAEASGPSRLALLDARGAYDFVAARLRNTSYLHGPATCTELRGKLGLFEFARDYRILSEELSVGRIRTWGQPGSSFRIAGRADGNENRQGER